MEGQITKETAFQDVKKDTFDKQGLMQCYCIEQGGGYDEIVFDDGRKHCQEWE